MNKDEQDFLTQKPTREKRRNEKKMDKVLNILIALVSVGIVIALTVIFSTEPNKKETAEEPKEPQTEEPAVDTPEQKQEVDEVEDVFDETDEETSEETVEDEVVVLPSDERNVSEVWTNEAWAPYPTEQTGTHVSTYESGHIDFEEKLKAFYSVIPLDPDASIVWAVRNNGSTTSSYGVISSKNKQDIYRVSIEWVDGEGWLPLEVQVLNTLP